MSHCTGRNTRFFVTAHSFSDDYKTAFFESVKFRGRYLVSDERRNKLRLAVPQRDLGNHLFEIILHPRSPIYIALKDYRGCYVGFKINGGLVSEPCELTLSDPETHILLEPFTKLSI